MDRFNRGWSWRATGGRHLPWAISRLSVPLALTAATLGCAHRAPGRPALPAPIPSPAGVTALSLSAEPRDYVGPCPTTVAFRGTVSVRGGTGAVEYRFTRSDGATAPTRSITAAAPGEHPISTDWTLGQPGTTFEGWQAVEVVAPNPLSSEPARFRLTCTSSSVAAPDPGPGSLHVTRVVLVAEPRDYVGPCPVIVRFTGTISVEGEGGRLAYRFDRSDGAIAPTEFLTVGIPGDKTVTATWHLGRQPGGVFEGWQVLEVLPPHAARSGPAGFRVTCR